MSQSEITDLATLRSHLRPDVKRLNLRANLTEIPTELFDLATSLEVLDLSHNQLSTLPDRLAELTQLRVIFLNHNLFTSVPEVLAHCPNLSMIGLKSNQIQTISPQALPPQTRWLILTDNQLTTLPDTIGQLSQLQKLMLAGNQLRSLPESLVNCTALELIRLAANQLPALPAWLLTLPRLSWLAYAGNPFCVTRSLPMLPWLNWADLTLGSVLGQGASGVIYRGLWQTSPTPQPVAIKLFKGHITSDGFPADELRACIAAEQHPHLVSGMGQIRHHPEGKAGLVFPFIPPTYHTLGGPPSLESCTRDTYPSGTTFAPAVVVRIALGIAAAAAHLHERGILHGDLYPHNTLVDQDGHCFLGDFGAASFYDRQNGTLSRSLEGLEVRAFGCLLDDLITRSLATTASTTTALTRLTQLQQDCWHPGPTQRPRFADLVAELGQLQPAS